MNLYGCFLMEKFRIGNVSRFSPKSYAHYRVAADRICSGDRHQEWVQIQHGLLCEQTADTVV
jgi:hypothetical protein